MFDAGAPPVVRRPSRIALESREVRAPAPDEANVHPAFAGLCATDLGILDGGLDEAHLRYPLVLGHEWSGRVVATGAGVDGRQTHVPSSTACRTSTGPAPPRRRTPCGGFRATSLSALGTLD